MCDAFPCGFHLRLHKAKGCNPYLLAFSGSLGEISFRCAVNIEERVTNLLGFSNLLILNSKTFFQAKQEEEDPFVQQRGGGHGPERDGVSFFN